MGCPVTPIVYGKSKINRDSASLFSNEQRAMSEKRGESDEAVGRGFQPFRRTALRQAQGDLPLPPPAGDTSDEVVGRGPRTRRFSGNERNQANATTRAVPERAAFRTVRGTVPTSGNSPYNGTVPTSQACDGGCRERFPTVPEGSPSTSSG